MKLNIGKRESSNAKFFLKHCLKSSRSYNRIVLPATSCLLCLGMSLTGCTKDEYERFEGGRVEIVPRVELLSTVVASGMSTRAGVDPLQDMNFGFVRSDESASGVWGDLGEEVLVATRTGGPDRQKLTFTPRAFYPYNGLKTRLAGFFPDNGEYDASLKTVRWTIDGTQDIMVALGQEGSRIQAMPTFTFNHMLAQLRFSVYAESQKAADYWGPITEVRVYGQRTHAELDVSGAIEGNLSFSFSDDSSSETFTAANLMPISTPVGADNVNFLDCDPMMIEPQEQDCELIVEVVTQNQGVQTVTIPPRPYLAGNAVQIIFRLATKVDVDFGIGIVEWGEGGVVEGSTSYPYVINDNTIVVADAFGAADASLYPTHDVWIKTPMHYESAWNDEMSGFNTCGRRFQVASVQVGTYTYPTSAITACTNYTQSGVSGDGQWRLPTARELGLIVENRETLTSCKITSARYWARTSNVTSAYYFITVSSGTWSTSSSNSNSPAALCVRDL